MNPMVDGWMGDDWFHNGAFRQQGMPYIYEQEATRKNDGEVVRRATTTTTTRSSRPARPASSAGAAGSSRWASGASSSRTRPTTPSGATRRWTSVLAARPLDGADDAGAQPLGPGGHLRRASPSTRRSSRRTPANDKVFLVMGPWRHGQAIARRQRARRAPLRQRHGAHLPPRGPAAVPRPVPEGRRAAGRRRAGDRLRDRHQRLAPTARLAGGLRRAAARCAPTPLYLGAGAKLGFAAPRAGDAPFDGVRLRSRRSRCPTVPRPVRVGTTAADLAALAGRRPARGLRPPRRRWPSSPTSLTAPVKISGAAGRQPGRLDERHRRRLGGQADRRLPRRGGRASRRWAATSSWSRPTSSAAATARASRRRAPIAAGQAAAATASRCRPRTTSSCPGHRIMVQVQSSWFPLYDRNPQTFVPNIFWAQAGRLPQGHAARLPRARTGELRRAAARGGAVKKGQSAA